MASMETLQLVIKQNQYLLMNLSTAIFIVLLTSGTLSNMAINIALMMALGYDTMRRLKVETTPDNIQSLVDLLKTWVVLCTIMGGEYVIVTVFNVLMVNVFLNIVKLVVSWLMYPTISMFYDLYIEKWFDKGVEIYENINNVGTKDINQNYNMLNYIKSFNFGRLANMNPFKKN